MDKLTITEKHSWQFPVLSNTNWASLHRPVMPAVQEAETGRLQIQACLDYKVNSTFDKLVRLCFKIQTK